MKKFIYIAALLIGAALTLTACGGDDEPKEDVTATATYQMTFSQDLLDACNGIILYYKGENGKNDFQPITSNWWTKSVTSNKFPAEFGVMYKFSTKSGADLKKEKYDLTCDLIFTVKTNKGLNHSNTVNIINSKGVDKSKVESVINRINGQSTGFKVTKDGNVAQDDNLKYE